MQYLLAMDVGNTHIKMQLMDGYESIGSFRLTTKIERTSDEYGVCIREFLNTCGLVKDNVMDVVISSVVPKIMYSLTSAIYKYLGKEPMVIGPGIKTGIQMRMENPKSVGADRIVDVVAGYHICQDSCIVIDFGTATTFNYISSKGVFEYTVIAPGLGISANALTANTAKLPDIEIQKPASILGRNTISGMQAGVVYGYIGLVEYIVKQMKKELRDEKCKVIATGGMGKVIANETDVIDIYDPYLAGKGIMAIYQKNKA